MYNRQQEELEAQANPLGVIGRMIQIKLEEENPELASQQKFEGTFYRHVKAKEIKALERIDNLLNKLLEESLGPESGMERIQHFQTLHQQAKEMILAEYK